MILLPCRLGATASISNDRNATAASTEHSQDKELSQTSQKGSFSSATASAKPKRYSSQRQRVTQQVPAAINNEPAQEQMPPVIPEGYYEQMGEIFYLTGIIIFVIYLDFL